MLILTKYLIFFSLIKDIIPLTIIFWSVIMLAATHDIATDAWGLTILSQ